MRFGRTLAVLMSAVVLPAAAAVSVKFVQPENYGDAGWGRSAEENLAELETWINGLGARYLSAESQLSIEVLDVALAGRPSYRLRYNQDVRVLRGGADWPIIRLRYTWQVPGKAPEVREETLRDMGYLQRPITAYRAESRLPYEKRMLEQWFRERFVTAPAS